MLSNPLQRYSPYQNLSQPGLVSNGHSQQPLAHNNGVDHMGQTAQYGLHQLHHNMGPQSPPLTRQTPGPKNRQQSFSSARGSASGQVRRRISRACDQCNQLRTKCDGQNPCAHCTEFGLGCEYARERKKRGKASRKDLAARAAAEAVQAKAPGGQTGDREHSSTASTVNGKTDASSRDSPQRMDDEGALATNDANNNSSSSGLRGFDQIEQHTSNGSSNMKPDGHNGETPRALEMNGYTAMTPQGYDRSDMNGQMMGARSFGQNHGVMSGYPDLPYPMQGQSPPGYHGHNAGFRIGASPMTGYPMGAATNASPGWGMPFPSPPAHFGHVHMGQNQNNINTSNVRYPVLEPLLPHLAGVLPVGLACDLIDLYFASSSSAQMHPMSPYVLGFVFRKRAFLHPTRPRRCQPALLASMLWVAAQTSDSTFLTSVPSARSKTCQKLLELTVNLLNPLIHVPSGHPSPGASPAADGVALGGLGVALPGSMSMDALTGESGAFGAAGNLDDVVTYIHLATVVSASEYKGASLRWWNAAWSLARELKLGRELPPGAPGMDAEIDGDADGLDEHDIQRYNPNVVSEEEREERRRIWWLVYTVDRHLALCYNRPLFLLDVECDGLKQPLDELVWQRGDFGSLDSVHDPNALGMSEADARPRGPGFQCHGHSIFGYFLPLMTILGEIVDLHHARNHPRFGIGFRSAGEWDDQAAEIARHLETYEHSLKMFEQQNLPKPVSDDKNDFHDAGEHLGAGGEAPSPSIHSAHTNSSGRMTESDIQTKIVVAYGTHVMHVLHILLAGKWDPINLIDDQDLWISTQGFITATGHAVSAAEAINQILEFDPGLEFMPFFFGVYLLQGSFLLLLIADKLQAEASASVVRACETIVRAHEACVVTLNTEYQRNFSRVMRSALAQVRGRVPEDLNEQHQRRRELLALYRWTGDGTGLAL
ncbi:Xylanolytic transcriptional activator-like protein [Emericellopsis cladophorae]|uniref:Xylanolytic transcriptional activator-like protein n=1 Tax=Emericellopsis cladophorae TaxID=2686198 RepID=A0A9P9Y168_9HYPO|nr:Xylanolytic transcriptional activator-like protein [Emericellopsis cladophorae]KAI6781426.1 Xylanolytic transcriptional activator-like protein [Emericellopsis cladophorae]